jgi:hypothetical protein
MQNRSTSKRAIASSIWVGSHLDGKYRVGWKRLTLTHALAYYDTELITALKSFIVLAPRVNKLQKTLLFVDLEKKFSGNFFIPNGGAASVSLTTLCLMTLDIFTHIITGSINTLQVIFYSYDVMNLNAIFKCCWARCRGARMTKFCC